MPMTKEVKREYDAARWAAGLTTAQRRSSVRKDQLREGNTRDDPLPQPAVHWKIKVPRDGLRIAVLPDGQAAPGRPDAHWKWVGQYLARKQPDVIVNIGDLFDLPSFGTHDPLGSAQREGRRYRKDLDAGERALELFENELAKVRGYNPVKLFTYGNHCYRADRRLEAMPELEGAIPMPRDIIAAHKWQVVPFLQPVIVAGVAFSHYFPGGVMGKPINKAYQLLSTQHMSCFAGHLQGRQIAYGRTGDGREMTAIISGSFYQHDEHYLPPMANRHWRGMWMLHEVRNGEFDEMAVSINFLKRKFG